ncbi:MAG TPA: integrase, partial [Clostridium sp.]|nr:integrase [Clostridium sp.]
METPKIHDKQIVRLDVNEMADFLDAVESGGKLSDHQKVYHERTKKRDLAITTLLLGTGM